MGQIVLRIVRLRQRQRTKDKGIQNVKIHLLNKEGIFLSLYIGYRYNIYSLVAKFGCILFGVCACCFYVIGLGRSAGFRERALLVG